MLHFGVITLMPEMFESLKMGVTGRALENGLAFFHCWNPRDWSTKPSRQIDDKPYGGGPGMVMMYEPLHAAILHAKQQMPNPCKTIYLSPQGRCIRQAELNRLAKTSQSLLFVAGRYEGIDERVIEQDIDEEWSIGDFVLSGGEFAAMVFIDAILRLLPGSRGDTTSATEESFMEGLLEYPQYTRPASIKNNKNLDVPAVLLTGDHAAIHRWRRKQALGRTLRKRPDLLDLLSLSAGDKHLLAEIEKEKDVKI